MPFNELERSFDGMIEQGTGGSQLLLLFQSGAEVALPCTA